MGNKKALIISGLLICLLLPALASAETYGINIHSSDGAWLITTTTESGDAWPISIGQNEHGFARFCLKYLGDSYEAYFIEDVVSPTDSQGFYSVRLRLSNNRFSTGEVYCYSQRFAAEFWNPIPKRTYSFDFPTAYCTRNESPNAQCETHAVSFTLPVEVLASCSSSRDSCCEDTDCLPYCEGLVWHSKGHCDAAGTECNYWKTSYCDSHNECVTDSCDDYSGCTYVPSGVCATGPEPEVEEGELPPEPEVEDELPPEQDVTPLEPPVIAPPPSPPPVNLTSPHPSVNCMGDCELNGVCVGVGTKDDDSYCDTGGEWQPKKEENQFCQNTYECKNALCTDKLCRPLSHEVEEPKGIFARIFEWLRSLFGQG